MKLSLIIPIYNEIKTIDRCLENLAALPDWVEVLFADGGSTDGTAERIGDRYRVLACPKGRAKQMNAAAEAASGELLWFSHCDSLLPPEGPGRIVAAAQAGARFGCFHIRFDAPGFWMSCNAFMSDLRVRLWRTAFGDQGIFVEKALLEQLGGWPDLPIMEDLELSKRMRRSKVRLHLLEGAITTSARRYQGKHPLRTMLRMNLLRRLYALGWDIQDIARMYKDIR